MFFVLFLLQTFLACQPLGEQTPVCIDAPAAAPRQTPSPAADVVYLSADGGLSWQDVGTGLPEHITAAGSLLTQAGAVYLVAENGLYRHQAPPAAAAWQKQLDWPADEMIRLFPGRTGWYAGRYESGFYQIVPGSDIWLPRHAQLPDKTVHAVLETPDGGLLLSCNTGIFRSDDSGATWTHVFNGDGAAGFYPAADGTLTGLCFHGMLRSADGGRHWEWLLKDTDAYKLITRLDGRLTALIREDARWKQVAIEGGLDAWPHLAEGLRDFNIVYQLEQTDDYLFCSHEGGISRSADGGRSWEPVFAATRNGEVLQVLATAAGIFVVRTVGC